MSLLENVWVVIALKLAIATVVIFAVALVIMFAELKVSAHMQSRIGPYFAGGRWGWAQVFAEILKFLQKEDVIPTAADGPVFKAAPMVSLLGTYAVMVVIPLSPRLVVGDLDVGIFYALAAGAVSTVAILMAGWSSGNKYSLMGGLRSSAQMVSYEISLALAVVGALLVSGSLRPSEIVERQAGWFFQGWNVFGGGWQVLGFVIFVVAMFAETNRLPFDLPEAESELVSGYLTEFSAMKFSMFFMAEYVNMITGSALAVTLFLGGWQLGFPTGSLSGWPLWLLQIGAFVVKVAAFQFLFVWVRWTLPRFRYDQLMNIGWKRLLPLALANVFMTGLLIALR